MAQTRRALLLEVFCICVLPLGAEDLAAQDFKLYVANSRGDSISVIDMASLKVIGEIKAGDHIHGVCVQPDSKKLFVTVESDHKLRTINTVTDRHLEQSSLRANPTSAPLRPMANT